MANRYIYCDPTDLNITITNCNLTIDIEEVSVCDLLIGANYRLYVNGILHSGSPFVVNSSGILFPGGLTINSVVPITNVRLEFECDDCGECTIDKDLPITPTACTDCSVTELSVSLSHNCLIGLTYTINDGTGPYSVLVKKGVTDLFNTTVPSPGIYNYNSNLSNGTYTLIVTDVFGCVKQTSIIVSDCCGVNLSNLSYDCSTKTFSGNITAVNGSGLYLVEIGPFSFVVGAGPFSQVIDLLDGSYTVKVTDSVNANCNHEIITFINCGAMDLDISSICTGTVSGILLANPSGGTPSYYAEIYVNSPVDGNGCPTGSIYTTTGAIGIGGTIVQDTSWDNTTMVNVVLVDSLGRRTCFPAQPMLNCQINGFDFTTTFNCSGLTKQICVTPTAAGTYNITIGGGAPFSDTFAASQQKCYTTFLANGSYTVTMEKGGNLISHVVVVSDCNNYTASYDCTTGLTILENGSAWTGKIRVDGTPNPSFWNYTGPNTVFLADTTPNHVLNLYTASGTLIDTLTVSGIDCCNLTLTGVTAVCNVGSSDGYIEFDLTNIIRPLGTHLVQIFDSTNQLVDSDPSFAGTHFVSSTLPNGTYTITVGDNGYNVPNIGIGTGFLCTVTTTAILNCTACVVNISGSLSNSKRCPNITDPLRLRVSVANTNLFNVNYEIWRNDVSTPGPCLIASDPPPGSMVASGSLTPSQVGCNDFPLNSPGNIPCFYVKFIKSSDPTCVNVEFVNTAN